MRRLSWDYLRYVREHHAGLTVMEDGEHWFRTDGQMRFLDDWLRRVSNAAPAGLIME